MDSRPSRRHFFGTVALGAGGLGAGTWVGQTLADDPAAASNRNTTETASPARGGEPVPATGSHQAGIAIPTTPQSFGLTVVADVSDITDITILSRMGERLLDLLDDPETDTGDLTVTVGVGPRIVAAVDPTMPGSQPLPSFTGDTGLTPERTGGDLALIASASDPSVLAPSMAALLAEAPGATERWRQLGFRGPGEGGITRNLFGFHDGIIVPHGDDELGDHVWLRDDQRVVGGTILVLRRLRLDVMGFGERTVEEQEAMVGRRRSDGAPLSGGGPTDEASLTAKAANGEYLTPTGSHVRAAHPVTTGSALMLRRGYSFAEGDEVGLLFTCFQHDLRTFVATQQRIDERDEMMTYVTVTASATFLVLPGFDRDRPLGSTLRA